MSAASSSMEQGQDDDGGEVLQLLEEEAQILINGVTDAIVSVSGEPLRPHTWVVVSDVRSGRWGIGGKTLGLKDVRALQGRRS